MQHAFLFQKRVDASQTIVDKVIISHNPFLQIYRKTWELGMDWLGHPPVRGQSSLPSIVLFSIFFFVGSSFLVRIYVAQIDCKRKETAMQEVGPKK